MFLDVPVADRGRARRPGLGRRPGGRRRLRRRPAGRVAQGALRELRRLSVARLGQPRARSTVLRRRPSGRRRSTTTCSSTRATRRRASPAFLDASPSDVRPRPTSHDSRGRRRESSSLDELVGAARPDAASAATRSTSRHRTSARLGLRVVRVIAPELCQLDVSHRARFLGGRRLYTAPRDAGLLPRRSDSPTSTRSPSVPVIDPAARRARRERPTRRASCRRCDSHAPPRADDLSARIPTEDYHEASRVYPGDRSTRSSAAPPARASRRAARQRRRGRSSGTRDDRSTPASRAAARERRASRSASRSRRSRRAFDDRALRSASSRRCSMRPTASRERSTARRRRSARPRRVARSIRSSSTSHASRVDEARHRRSTTTTRSGTGSSACARSRADALAELTPVRRRARGERRVSCSSRRCSGGRGSSTAPARTGSRCSRPVTSAQNVLLAAAALGLAAVPIGGFYDRRGRRVRSGSTGSTRPRSTSFPLGRASGDESPRVRPACSLWAAVTALALGRRRSAAWTPLDHTLAGTGRRARAGSSSRALRLFAALSRRRFALAVLGRHRAPSRAARGAKRRPRRKSAQEEALWRGSRPRAPRRRPRARRRARCAAPRSSPQRTSGGRARSPSTHLATGADVRRRLPRSRADCGRRSRHTRSYNVLVGAGALAERGHVRFGHWWRDGAPAPSIGRVVRPPLDVATPDRSQLSRRRPTRGCRQAPSVRRGARRRRPRARAAARSSRCSARTAPASRPRWRSCSACAGPTRARATLRAVDPREALPSRGASALCCRRSASRPGSACARRSTSCGRTIRTPTRRAERSTRLDLGLAQTDRDAAGLSGGQRRRLAVALALVGRPAGALPRRADRRDGRRRRGATCCATSSRSPTPAAPCS